MNCSNCGREEVSSAARYCIRCGAALEDASIWSDTEQVEGDDLQSVVVRLGPQVNRLQSQVNRHTPRIYALEDVRSGPAPATPPDKARTGG